MSRFTLALGAIVALGSLTGCATGAAYHPEKDPVAQWLAAEHPQALTTYLSEREAESDEGGLPWKAALTTGFTVLAYQNPVLGLSSNASAFLTMTGAPHLLGDDNEKQESGSAAEWMVMMLRMEGEKRLQSRIGELESQLEQKIALLDARLVDELDNAKLSGIDNLSLADHLETPISKTLTTTPSFLPLEIPEK